MIVVAILKVEVFLLDINKLILASKKAMGYCKSNKLNII